MKPASDPHTDELLRGMAAAGIGVWSWDCASDTVILTDQAARALGCDGRVVIDYAGLLDLIHPADRSAVDGALRQARAPAGAFDLDFRPAAPTLGPWLRTCGRFTPNSRQETTAHGILIEATGRRSDQDSVSRLAAIVTSSDDAIISKTLTGIVTGWNRGAEAVFGYSAEEMVGQPISILNAAGHEHQTEEILRRIQSGERIEHYETRRRRKDGAVIDVSITVSPLWDRDGQLVGASKIARDVTAAKRAQAALREREAHLQSVLDTVPDAMIVIDTSGSIQSFSRTAQHMFGYTATECIGCNVRMLMPSGDKERHDAYLRQYLATGERHVIGRGRITVGRRKDGATFPMELSVGEVNSGDRRFFTGFIRDLTEREAAQRQLRDLQTELIHLSRFTAMGEMASTLAHELNQPLTAPAG